MLPCTRFDSLLPDLGFPGMNLCSNNSLPGSVNACVCVAAGGGAVESWGDTQMGMIFLIYLKLPNISPLKIHCFSSRYRDGDGDSF